MLTSHLYCIDSKHDAFPSKVWVLEESSITPKIALNVLHVLQLLYWDLRVREKDYCPLELSMNWEQNRQGRRRGPPAGRGSPARSLTFP